MAKSPAATPSSNAPPSPLSPPIVTVAAAASHCTSPSAPATRHRQQQPEWTAESPAVSPSSGTDGGSTSSGSGAGGGRGQSYHYDGDTEITLKSIEQTLLPLVKQVRTTLTV